MRRLGIACLLICASVGLTEIGGGSKTVEEEAITVSGRRVLLYSDRTWELKAPQESNDVLFRGIRWGATKAEIVKREKNPFGNADSNDILMFQDEIGGRPVIAGYCIVGGRFVRGVYLFTEEHSNDNTFFGDFDAVEGLLKNKYGAPVDHRNTWLSDFGKDDPTRWGMAVAMGRLTWDSTWESGPVTVIHYLCGDNARIKHAIEYRHRDFSEFENVTKTEEARQKL